MAQKAQEVVRSLPRWKVEEYRETQGRLHATRQTLWMRFIDDVNIYIIQGLDGVTRLEMTSQSRVGRGDFGQNRRNLKEFLTRLDAQLTPLSLQEKAL